MARENWVERVKQLLLAAAIILLFSSVSVAAAEIKLENTVFPLGSIVNFEVIYSDDDSEQTGLEIISESESFELFGENEGLHKFLPSNIGTYHIVLQGADRKIIASQDFEVVQYVYLSDAQSNQQFLQNQHTVSPDDSEGLTAIKTDREIYFEGEEVKITIFQDDNSVLFVENSDGKKYEFLGERGTSVSFYPEIAGKYYAVLKNTKSGIMISAGFDVMQKESLEYSEAVMVKNARNLNVQNKITYKRKDSVGIVLSELTEADTKIQSRGIDEIFYEVKKKDIITGQVYDANVELKGIDIREIKIKSLKAEEGKSIGLDEFRENWTIEGKKSLKNYAINLEELDFFTAEISAVARGTELYECKQWNFTTRTCFGVWVKKMNIIPGQEYSLILTPGDPGYAETGVASINTKKSIYEPGETAEIIIAVLDTAGFLVSDADIELNVTSPSDETVILQTSKGDIREIEKGIYLAEYIAEDIGYYSLSVSVLGKNVNSSMFSYFLVNTTHEFDIIRNSPFSTDPFRTSFSSSIQVVFREQERNYTTINLTEKIPSDFVIIEALGAEITMTDNFYFLKWINVSDGETVSYRAIPPLITPELWELRSWIDYENKIFNEARPWYLAVDPSSFYDPSATITAGWSTGTGTTFAEIDDAVRYPSIPDTNNYVASLANAGVTSNFRFPNITEAFIDNMTLWVYTGTGTNAAYIFNLYQNGVSRCSRSLARTTPTGWYNCSWQNPTGDLSNMSIYLSVVSKSGGGASTSAYVYSSYLEVGIGNYPPNVTLLKPDNNSIMNVSSFNFNFTVSDDRDSVLKNCTLYSNFSGAWLANVSIFNVINGSQINITRNVADGRYIWNVQCYDQGNKSSFALQNRTVIVNSATPLITNQAFNQTVINQSNSIKFNATITDLYGISSSLITLRYPDGTSKNFSLSAGGTNEYYAIFSDTNLTGIYNVTYVWANDTYNQAGYNSSASLSFIVQISPPSPFNLIYPENNKESQNLLPIFSWTQTQDETFANYTVLIGKTLSLESPQFRYYTYQIANVSYAADFAIDANSEYFWKVVAMDTYGTQTNSTETFRYINDRISPNVSLESPEQNEYSTSSEITFQYIPSDINTLQRCDIYTNNSGIWSSINFTTTPMHGVINEIQAILGEGYTKWNINCTDNANNSAFSQFNRTVIVDISGPVINLQYPQNFANITNTNIINFTANTSDVYSGISFCELIVDGQLKQTKSSISEGSNFTFVQFLTNGVYVWEVNCTDSNGIESSSAQRTINISSVDADVPIILLNYPAQNEHVGSGNIVFNYTPQDATGIENCSLYVDGTYNKSDLSVDNLLENFFPVNGFTEGLHTWNVTCYDNSSYKNIGSTRQNFTVDLTDPVVQIVAPENNYISNKSNMEFNYTVNETNILKCELWGNFSGLWSMHQENMSEIKNNQLNSFVSSIPNGNFIWTVECYDKSGRESVAENNTLLIDTISPAYLNISISPASPSLYTSSGRYDFNISWSDSEINTVIFESNFTGIMLNRTIYNYGGVYNFSVYSLAPGNYSYRWYANDTAKNQNLTSQFIYEVIKGEPSLSLYLNGVNGNLTINEDNVVNITGILSIPQYGEISLYIDDVLAGTGISSLTNMSNFSHPGIYNVGVVFLGNSNYSQVFQNFSINVTDTTAPEINLLYPENSTTISSGDLFFQYYVNDSSEVSSCSLFVNNMLNSSESEIIEDDINIFFVKIGSGAYTWRIECTDTSSNIGISKTYAFTAVDTTTINVNVSSSRYSPERGEIINISTNASNVFGGPLSADIRTDVILGFTNLNWYDSAWKKRKPIYLNETQGANHINELAEVNITGLGNSITNCQRELRIVYNQSPNSYAIPFMVYSGDNATWCYVVFRVNLSANSLNQNNYYVYYNNSAAPNPGYDVITTADKTYFAQTAAADEGTPLNPANIVGNNDATSATISVSGGGAGVVSAHGAGFINTTPGNLILKVQARYRYEVPAMSGNWYLRYSTNAGTSYSNSYTGTTTQAKATSAWTDITGAYSVLNWTELNRTRLQGRADKGSGSGTSSMLLYWVEMNVTYRIISNITQALTGAEQQHIFTKFNQTDALGNSIFEFNTSGREYANYSVISSAEKEGYTSAFVNTTIQIVKDVTPPSVMLLNPEDFEERGEGIVHFTYMPYDINLKNCTLYYGNSTQIIPREYNTTPLNGKNNTFNGAFFTTGVHQWNVLCYDDNNNSAFATTNFTLNISAPNLKVYSEDIYFGEGDRVEGTNITVYANITNIGLTAANQSFAIQFFAADPDLGGLQIGGDFILPNLSAGNSSIHSVEYNLKAGKNSLFVRVDAYNSINETSENDNEAENNVSVSLYQYYYGNVSKNTALGSTFADSFILFENSSTLGGNIYFADADSSFSFPDLQALTKNSIGQIVGDDFSNLDTAMGTSSFEDSIKIIWGGGTESPIQTRTFNISNRDVTGVPVVNSTINENFVTGILWDTNDDLGNLQYDATEREDIVFVANINPQQWGEYGLYDSEIKLPATLREYKAGDDKIVFYVEIK